MLLWVEQPEVQARSHIRLLLRLDVVQVHTKSYRSWLGGRYPYRGL